MAGYYSAWRLSRTTLAIVLATSWIAQVAFGQYTYVQDSDGVGAWDDVANWLDGGSNTTYPNGIGVTAQINQPIKSGVGGYTLDMPTTDVTVGQLTIDNTSDIYATKITMVNHAPGRLIFEDSSGTAKYIETTGAATAPANVQNSIQVLIQLNSDLEITQNNYPNLNTGTIFTNRIDGSASRTIIKKGLAGIQFNLNAALNPGEGFFGQILIQEGAIRLINKTSFISTVSGMTVSNGGQLQLADNAGTAVPDYNMATGAVLNLNGVGTNAPSSGPQGALRFGIQGGRTTTFHNPVVLQTNSVISVGAVNSIGAIDQPVSGAGSLTKHGDGKLVLSSATNSWAGDTTILSGPTTGTSVLSLTNPTLADGRDVLLSATRTALDLNFAATDTIRSLYFDGIGQATGIWGATGSGAAHETSLITGTGFLNVTTLPVPGVPGDYNNNGTVDAGDYVVWRKGGPLQNEVDNPGVVNAQDYTEWRARFGNTSGSGSSLEGSAVPEPTTLVLLLLVAPFVGRRTLGRTRT